jgi:VIT1/CCC1 family predicted Fe2+/Mn2+ transporter
MHAIGIQGALPLGMKINTTETKTTKQGALKTGRELGVVDQMRVAMHPEHRLATGMGFLLGGFVPIATYMVAHYEFNRAVPFYSQFVTLLILGGLGYSAKTVFDWARLAFAIPLKALGFVVLVEGVMTTSANHWLALAALGYLVAINGIATGTRLALHK